MRALVIIVIFIVSMIGSPSSGRPLPPVVGTISSVPVAQQHIVIPAFFFSDADWNRAVAAAPTATSIVFDISIFQKTPCAVQQNDPNAARITQAHAARIQVFGYVDTSNGARDPAAIRQDVDSWYSCYDPDGIFFDQGPTNPALSSFYQALYTYVKTKSGARGTTVWLNAAGVQFEGVMQLADIVNLWEDSCAQYAPANYYQALPWLPQYAPTRISHVVYGCTTVNDVQQAVTLSKQRGAGYVYVFDGTSANYDHLPPDSLWQPEVAAVACGLTTTTRPLMSTLHDSFSGSTIAPDLWRVTTHGGATASEAGGTLILDPTMPNTGSAEANVISGDTYQLTGSAAAVQVVEVVAPTTGVSTVFTLLYDNGNYLQWHYEGGTLFAIYSVSPDLTEHPTLIAQFPYSPSSQAWWRIRETGGTVFWETSGDGLNWNSAGSLATGQLFSLAALKVDFNAREFGSGTATPGRARYANLNTPPGSLPVPGPVTAPGCTQIPLVLKS